MSNAQAHASPDLVLHGGEVITMADHQEAATAIAVRADRIAAVGSDADVLAIAGTSTRRIDLDGAVVIPGFNDSHNHMLETALNWQRIDLSGSRSIKDLLAALSHRAGALAEGAWLVGSPRWHESHLAEKRLPTLEELDGACPHHPVFLPRGGHVAGANSLALKQAGISESTADPSGGRYERDADTGRLTGQLFEPPAMAPVSACIPPPTPEDMQLALRAAVERYHAAGITSIRDPWVLPAFGRAYQTLWSTAELTVRTNLMPYLDPSTPLENLLDRLRSWPVRTGFGDAWFRIGGLKLVLDGGVEGGWFHEPYPGVPEYHGFSLWNGDALAAVLETAAELGWSVGMHVVGDAAFDQALDAVEAVNRKTPVQPLRWSLEHAFFPSPGGIERVRQLGMLVTVQMPLLYELAGNMLKYWGRSWMERIYPLRKWTEAGVLLAGGSDSDVSVFEPLSGLQWMITRETALAGVVGESEALAPHEALACYTRHSAYLTFEEKSKGTLEVEQLADLVVLDDNPLTCESDRIGGISVLMTMVGGQVVHSGW